MSARSAAGFQRPLFVVLDGIDGCGKSTQAARLARALEAAGPGAALHLRDPGSTAVGEDLRTMLLGHRRELSPALETLLFTAARRAMLDELVAPALARDEHVVCERFHASTFAYQAVAGKQDEEAVLALLRAWAGNPAPDVLLWLDLPLELALARRGGARDRIEEKDLAYQRAVARGYARYAERADKVALGERIVRIDAALAPEAVEAAIWEAVLRAR